MFKNRKDQAHFVVSIVKSLLRIAAGFLFIYGQVALGGILIIAAEILGIVEELVV